MSLYMQQNHDFLGHLKKIYIIGFKSSVELVFVYVYDAPTLNKALLLLLLLLLLVYTALKVVL